MMTSENMPPITTSATRPTSPPPVEGGHTERDRERDLLGWYRTLEELDGAGTFEREQASSLRIGGRYIRGEVPRRDWTRARMDYLQKVISRATDAMADIAIEESSLHPNRGL